MSLPPNPRMPVLVAGVGPIPPERPECLMAPGVRVWGMARELARAGHPVRLVTARFGGTAGATVEISRYDVCGETGLDQPRLEGPRRGTVAAGGVPALLAQEAEDCGASAAIGTTDLMNHALAEAFAGLPLPVWMDFFGDPMAEVQLLAGRGGSDERIDEQWAVYAAALARADRVSGCSREQCAALLGELGAVGRLTRHTAGAALVERVPPWYEPIPIDLEPVSPLRGAAVGEDAFVVVQTGGFNTWLDVPTLFDGLDQAMEGYGRIHFACTGGAIDGHYSGGFEEFARRVEASRHRDRFHLLGWLPAGLVPRVIAEGDVGLNVDLAVAEGRLGTRNRILDWLGGGLEVISTPGCELADELAGEGHLTIVPHGDAGAVAGALLAAAGRPRRDRTAAGEDAGRHVRRAYHPAESLRPLLDWAAAPEPAPDLLAYSRGLATPPMLLTQARGASRAERQRREEAQRLGEMERRLAELEGSRLVRLAMRLRRPQRRQP